MQGAATAGDDPMQYLVSVIADGTEVDSPEVEAAIDAFNERLQAGGYWVFAAGAGGPNTATVVDNRSGKAVITDGPFVETKEHMAGFWVWDVPDFDVVLKLAVEASKACNRRLEVRPLLQG
jgi:hypothetical protein